MKSKTSTSQNSTNPMLAAGFWERWLGAHEGRIAGAPAVGATTRRKKLAANNWLYAT